MRRNARGSTLIFVLGILALLSLFAISFASMTRPERTAALNWTDNVRADLAARAGLNAGVSALREQFAHPSPNSSPSPAPAGYTSIPPATPPSSATPHPWAWYYLGHKLNPVSTGNGIPLQLAVNSAKNAKLSLQLDVPSTDPVHEAIPPLVYSTLRSSSTYAITPHVSGTLGGTYAKNGDVYSLKILDAQGMLDVNGNRGDLLNILPVLGSEAVTELQQISGTLAADPILAQTLAPGYRVIDQLIPLRADPSTGPSGNYPDPFTSHAKQFLDYRDALPGGRFTSKEQIHAAFLSLSGQMGGLGGENENRIQARGDAWFALFRDYLSCWGERDSNVVAGGASVSLPATQIANGMATRRPVNLNTAPKPVLVAILSVASAVDVDPASPNNLAFAENATTVTVMRDTGTCSLEPISPFKHGSLGATTLTTSDARKIANQIIAWRTGTKPNSGPFRSWRDVYCAFNDGYKAGGLPNDKWAAALASLCPCYLPLGWNPDRSLFYWDDADNPDSGTVLKVAMDKSGGHSFAEGCFESGVFEIESLGRVYAGTQTATAIAGEVARRAVVRIGGTTWIRGQRDLSASVSDAMGAPEPAGQAPPLVGGWVQAIPGTSGMNAQAWTVDKSLESGGKVVADGFLQQHDYGLNGDSSHDDCGSDAMNDPSGASASPDQGHVSLWVKQPQSQSGQYAGTNECLFAATRGYDPGDRHAEPGTEGNGDAGAFGAGASDNGHVSDMGVGVRLEKYGNKLYACRFFYGFPDGAAPAVLNEPTVSGKNADASNPTIPYSDMHHYIWSSSLDWKPGTWHHVSLTWSSMNLDLKVDGVSQAAGTPDPNVQTGYGWQNNVPGFFPQGAQGMNWDQWNQWQADQAEMNQLQGQMNAISATYTSTAPYPDLYNKYQQVKADADRLAHLANSSNTWATDVEGDHFSAELGLHKMMIRSFYPPTGGNNKSRYDVLGYDLTAFGNHPYTTLATLGTEGQPFKLQGSQFSRWCNGTFDDVRVSMTSSSTPAYSPRFNTQSATVTLPIALPPMWTPRAHGFFAILAHGANMSVSANGASLAGDGLFGAGVQATSSALTLVFSPGAHSNVTPWALAGAWISYEVPTQVLEGSLEVDGS